MQHLSLKAHTTAIDQELGEFTAIASAWDADRERDTIDRRAFDRTIEAWRRSGKRLPLLLEHTATVIGSVDPFAMEATNEGLVVSGEVERESGEGQMVWRTIKSGAAGFSIGFMAEARPRPGGGGILTEIDLLEISATVKPVHPSTRALSWKSLEDPGDGKAITPVRVRSFQY